MAQAVPSTPIYSSLAVDPDLAEIVEMFVDEMPDRVAAIAEAWTSGDLEHLGRLAHQLKGAAGSYGFDEVTPYAAALERTARGGGAEEEIAQATEELISLCSWIRGGAPR